MLSTLVSLYKLLGTGNFFKVLLLLLKAFFAEGRRIFRVATLIYHSSCG